MSMFDNPDNILLIQKLLYPHRDNNSSDSEDEGRPLNPRFGPANIGPSVQAKTTKSDTNKESVKEVKEDEPKEEMTIEKFMQNQEKEDKDMLENRKIPEYAITYKQAVGTEDVFLQMGNRTSATSSCEDMIIEIKLPEETVDVNQMEISVTEKEIDLATPIYRLKLPLAHLIDPDKSTAKYFTEKRVLCLTCRLNRELDFINF